MDNIEKSFEQRVQQCKQYQGTYDLMTGDGEIETEITETDIILKKCKVQGEFIMPDFINIIGEKAFYGNREITSIEITGSVTVVENLAFGNCVKLAKIDLGKSVKIIGQGAFNSCTTLKELVITESATKIGNSCFCWCDSLEKLSIPLRFKKDISKFDLMHRCIVEYTPRGAIKMKKGELERAKTCQDYQDTHMLMFGKASGMELEVIDTDVVLKKYTASGEVEIPEIVTVIGKGGI